MASPRSCADEATRATVSAALETGNFGYARTMALGLAGPEREHALEEVAAAQSRAGAAWAASITRRLMGSATSADDARTAPSRYQEQATVPSTTMSSAASARSKGQDGGSSGGASMADYAMLMDLITTTIDPDSWEEVGGASMSPFPSGVVVDSVGVMARIAPEDGGAYLREVERIARADALGRSFEGAADRVPGVAPERPSPRRIVSLKRLEAHLADRARRGLAPDEPSRFLGYLYELEAVVVDPASGDILLVGPSGRPVRDPEGRLSDADSGRPLLRLDDLVTCFRQAASGGSVFGCNITPKTEGLAAAQTYLAESARKPLRAGERARTDWLTGLREAVGRQDVTIFGLAATSHVGQVMAAADHHMKLVGIGLEDAPVGVVDYFTAISGRSDSERSSALLRWWFVGEFDRLLTTPEGTSFALVGRGLKVLSENERLAAGGERIATGTSDEPTSRFAQTFTEQFAALATRYPVYRELQSIYHLAAYGAVLSRADAFAHPDAPAALLGLDGETDRFGLLTTDRPAISSVDSVVNAKSIGRGQIVAAVSGGVLISPAEIVKSLPIDARQANLPTAVGITRNAPPRVPELPSVAPTAALAWWWD